MRSESCLPTPRDASTASTDTTTPSRRQTMFMTTLTRRAAIFSAAALLAVPALAEQFPSRPIKILVAFGAGGTADSVTRLYAQKMSEVLNTPVIVENKPGANQITAIRSLMG